MPTFGMKTASRFVPCNRFNRSRFRDLSTVCHRSRLQLAEIGKTAASSGNQVANDGDFEHDADEDSGDGFDQTVIG